MMGKDDDREMDGRKARNKFHLPVLFGYVHDLATYEPTKAYMPHKLVLSDKQEHMP